MKRRYSIVKDMNRSERLIDEETEVVQRNLHFKISATCDYLVARSLREKVLDNTMIMRLSVALFNDTMK